MKVDGVLCKDEGCRVTRGAVARVVVLSALALLATAVLPGISRAQAACTITWDGQLGTSWHAFQANGPGAGDDVYNWSPERYPDANDDVCFPSGAVASTTLETQNTPTVRSFTISAGATLNITQVQMIVGADSVNAGTLNMSGPVPITVSDGAPADGELLTNTGTINFTAGPSDGIRSLKGDLLNQGTINVDHPQASLEPPGAGAPSAAILTNQGTIDISVGNTLRSIFSTFVHGPGSVITGGGTMNMDQERFEISGNAQVVAPTDINMTNSTLAGTTGAATGNVDIHGAFTGGGPSTLEGTVPAGITVDVDRTTLKAPAVTTTVNAGRINLNGDGAQLQVLPNDSGANSTSKLTNASTGTIEFTADNPPATTGLRLITGNLVNQGTILVNDPEAGFQFPGGTSTPPKLTNAGTLTISPGSSLRAIFGIFVHGPGSVINGGGTMNMDQNRFEISGNSQVVAGTDINMTNSTLAGTAGAATGNVDVHGAFAGGGPSTLEGTIPAGVTVDIDNTTLQTPAADPPLGSPVNAGRININGSGAQLKVTPNDNDVSTTELTNTGTIEFTSGGTAGLRQMTGDVLNQGTLLVNHPEASFQFPGGSNSVPVLANQGVLRVSAGNVLRVLSATLTNGTGGLIEGVGTINNSSAVENTGGVVAPGASPGVLTITGDYLQGPGGTLEVEVSGPAAGTGHDQLVVGGTANLGGTLDVSTSGFLPATGQTFKVVDAPAPPNPAVSGTFSSVQQSGGTTYAVAYGTNDVVLAAQAPPDSDDDGTPDASDECPNVAGPASNGGCPVVTPPPDGDGDGTPDASDECPNVAGPASNGGCPVVVPPADDCDEAKDKLGKAKAKLKKLKKNGAPKSKVKKAKKKVKKAKAAVEEACA